MASGGAATLGDPKPTICWLQATPTGQGWLVVHPNTHGWLCSFPMWVWGWLQTQHGVYYYWFLGTLCHWKFTSSHLSAQPLCIELWMPSRTKGPSLVTHPHLLSTAKLSPIKKHYLHRPFVSRCRTNKGPLTTTNPLGGAFS